MENLDYDKYVKNQEVREALFLLKNKVEKDKENEPINTEDKERKEDEEKKEENANEENIQLPPIDSNYNKTVPSIHEKEWDGKDNNEENEIMKKKMADKILKMDKVEYLVKEFFCLKIFSFNFFIF